MGGESSAQILHAAQQFGSNEYAIDILEDALNAGADVNGQVHPAC